MEKNIYVLQAMWKLVMDSSIHDHTQDISYAQRHLIIKFVVVEGT
jgi:hypothetical protein